MTMWSSLITSAVALCVLTFGMYIPRHHRGDLAAAYLVIGVGLAMIMLTLRQATTLGHDVAYFFATLSIGIIGGLTAEPMWLTPVLCAGLLVALFVTDHPRFSSANQRQVVLLDRVYSDQQELKSALSTLLRAHIHRADVRRLDTLRQTTLVDVRFRPDRGLRP
jgi:hypothetical protein